MSNETLDVSLVSLDQSLFCPDILQVFINLWPVSFMYLKKTSEMKIPAQFFPAVIIILNSGFISLSAQNGGSWKASEDVVERLSKGRGNVNYYEEKVPDYVLPDPLLTSGGTKVSNAKQWTEGRRQEILELFRENVYGRVPSTPYAKTFTIVSKDDKAIGGLATLKMVDIKISAGEKELVIHLTLFTPNTGKPSPVFLLIDNRGPQNTDPTRQKRSEFWPVEEAIARGYAMAVFYNADLDPDNFDDFNNGIHAVLDKGSRNDSSWGTLAAWAWGASRCMDYLETDPDIDSKKVAVVGHSRGGKTALWTGAEDQRFSLVISNESGCGGAALARRRFGETVSIINTAFPHWFCLNYRKYNDNEDNMPADMHMLMGLIAPRSLYIACADEDLWGDPAGSYMALQHALPVFNLFKPSSSLPGAIPPLNTPVTGGRTGFHIRAGGHNMLLKDWNWFMDFADSQWK